MKRTNQGPQAINSLESAHDASHSKTRQDKEQQAEARTTAPAEVGGACWRRRGWRSEEGYIRRTGGGGIMAETKDLQRAGAT